MIEEYEKHHKNDYDILSMKATYYVYLGDLEKAKGYLIEAVKRNHYDVEAIYNLATVYELNSEFEMAYENYSKALILEEVYKDNVINIDEISNKLKEIMAILKERINGIEDEELQNYRLKVLIKLNQIIRKNNDVKYNGQRKVI